MVDSRGADQPPSGESEHGLGGDPACWLHQVCEECGRLIEDEFAERCPACGHPRGPDTTAC